MDASGLRAGCTEPDRVERTAPRAVLHDDAQTDREHAHGEAENGEAACHHGHVCPVRSDVGTLLDRPD